MSLAVGDVIRYPGTGHGPRQATAHLHVVVKIDYDKGDVYCLPISSEKLNLDATCKIAVADKVPGVTEPCFVAYFHAKKSGLKGLRGMLAGGTCQNLGSVPPAVYARMLAGISASNDTEQWFIDAVAPAAKGKVLRAAS